MLRIIKPVPPKTLGAREQCAARLAQCSLIRRETSQQLHRRLAVDATLTAPPLRGPDSLRLRRSSPAGLGAICVPDPRDETNPALQLLESPSRTCRGPTRRAEGGVPTTVATLLSTALGASTPYPEQAYCRDWMRRQESDSIRSSTQICWSVDTTPATSIRGQLIITPNTLTLILTLILTLTLNNNLTSLNMATTNITINNKNPNTLAWFRLSIAAATATSTFSGIPAYNRSNFNIGAPSYGAIPPAALVAGEQDTSPTSAIVRSNKPSWVSEPETSSHQPASLNPSDMRYIKGPLDVLNAEQYDDGRYTSRRGLYKADAHVLSATTGPPNTKKRERKVSQNDRAEPTEEIKRARGRPRLEGGDSRDMKERRKEQIRLAQRAYRNRKETTITDLEAKVAGLEASNQELNATFRSLLMEYVDKHAINAQIPELGRRLQQFQAVLNQRCSEAAGHRSDEATSDAKLSVDSAVPDQSQLESQTVGDRPEPQPAALPATQQPQQLLGGIIVTHEPEPPSIIQDSGHPSDDPLEDASYTFVRMPNLENASFGFNLGFLDNPMQSQWSLPNWESLPVFDSGAFLERTLGRRIHRRTTEKAAVLLAMKNPPSEAILRVFGFVRNYASLDDIRQRVKNTLSRSADEDMNAYAQPFHHIGGSGTHFAGDAKTVSFTGGAPFPNSGFGMGPFNEKTTAVRDDLLDNLQRTNLPGWQGEWFDSYDIEKYLAQKSINLPQGGDGYVEIPPGDFYDNPLEDQPSTTKNDSLQGSISRKVGAGFNVSPDVRGEGMPMHSSRQLTMARNAPYPPPTSSIEGMLSIPAPVDLWRLGSMGPDYLAISQSMSGNMSSLLAYHNTTSLGFSDSSHLLYSSPTTPMNMASSQPRNKKVWFSVDKFIENLGSKCTCVGRGPAFRKKDVVAAFWEAAKPGPE